MQTSFPQKTVKCAALMALGLCLLRPAAIPAGETDSASQTDPAVHAPLCGVPSLEARACDVQDALALAREQAALATAPPTLDEWLAGAHYSSDPERMKLSKLTDREKAQLVNGPMDTMEISRPLLPWSHRPFHDALRRHAGDPLRDDAMVGVKRWGEIKRFLAGKNGPELLFLVNTLWNQYRFAGDAQTWGIDEYWAVPAEFVRRRQGDCDDYVMAKYLTLRDLGFPVDRMRLVVGKLKRRDAAPNEFHVVLRCQTDKGAFILENNRKVLMDERTCLKRFRPVLSFNEKTEWLNFSWE